VCVCVRPTLWVPGSVGVCMCVRVALRIQHAKTAILPFTNSLAPPYISMLSHKRHNFRKKVTEYKVNILIFYTNLSKVFLILRIIHWDIVINLKSSLSKVPVILFGFLWNLNLWDIFSEKILNIKCHENSSCGSRVSCGRTDGHDEANSSFSRFQNASKNAGCIGRDAFFVRSL
jgi:hypothetical protein